MANNGDKLLDPGDYAYAMHGMASMAQLVEEYMQPSRGIDDDDADINRKSIVS